METQVQLQSRNLTYFISYKFYCGKGKKKEEITSIYLK